MSSSSGPRRPVIPVVPATCSTRNSQPAPSSASHSAPVTPAAPISLGPATGARPLPGRYRHAWQTSLSADAGLPRSEVRGVAPQPRRSRLPTRAIRTPAKSATRPTASGTAVTLRRDRWLRPPREIRRSVRTWAARQSSAAACRTGRCARWAGPRACGRDDRSENADERAYRLRRNTRCDSGIAPGDPYVNRPTMTTRGSTHVRTAFMGLTSSRGVTVG